MFRHVWSQGVGVCVCLPSESWLMGVESQGRVAWQLGRVLWKHGTDNVFCTRSPHAASSAFMCGSPEPGVNLLIALPIPAAQRSNT